MKKNILVSFCLSILLLFNTFIFVNHLKYRITEFTASPQIFIGLVDRESKIGSPIELKNDDRLINLDGNIYEDTEGVLDYFSTRAGEEIKIRFESDGQELETNVYVPEEHLDQKVGIGFITRSVEPNIMVSMSPKALVFGPIGSLAVLFLEWISLCFILFLSLKQSKQLYKAIALFMLYSISWWVYISVFVERL